MDVLFAQSLFLLMIVFLITWLFIAIIVYFIPAIVAVVRKHTNVVPIALMNLLLGWSVLGWIASLLWALNGDIKGKDE